eukprot:TRINITY_DN8035_c1_g1_i5.p1 TRINITY_DN8035_c1_g1~~TRINITY_DN8035_c1_g1_i5.p1  ORF type:complete len:203 (-),score=-7.48 TRINITY_DN8035_c1_g1_i5:132-740(-)
MICVAVAFVGYSLVTILQLRVPSSNKTLEKVFQVSQGVSVLMIGAAFTVTIIHQVPFNSMIIFICIQVLGFMVSTFPSIQAKLSENDQFQQHQQKQDEFPMRIPLIPVFLGQASRFTGISDLYTDSNSKEKMLQKLRNRKSNCFQEGCGLLLLVAQQLWIFLVTYIMDLKSRSLLQRRTRLQKLQAFLYFVLPQQIIQQLLL